MLARLVGVLLLVIVVPVYAGDTFGVSGTEEWRFAGDGQPHDKQCQ